MLVRKRILKVILLLSLVGIVYSLSTIIINVYTYKESRETYTQLKSIYNQAENQSERDGQKALKEINKDYAGWLSVDGTEIDYPVVHGADNDFYLNHSFYQENNAAGAIYMDYRVTPDELNEHSIIYGHNMKDNSMFGTLKKVLEDDFSHANRIRFETKDNVYEWEIISAYQTRETDWMVIDFNDHSDQKSMIEQFTQASHKLFGNEEINTNNIITLATCTEHFSDERTVVHAKLVEGNK